MYAPTCPHEPCRKWWPHHDATCSRENTCCWWVRQNRERAVPEAPLQLALLVEGEEK